MARPKKPRLFKGVLLADNLYPDPKSRENYWVYVLPDGKKRIFQSSSVDLANDWAESANQRRDAYSPRKKLTENISVMEAFVSEYIEYRERNNIELKESNSWKNRRYAMMKFAREISLTPREITRQHIVNWWDSLSYSDQKLRHAEFRKLFGYLMGRELTPKLEFNPFTTNDDRPRLYTKSKPPRQRERLTLPAFWAIYRAAGELEYDALQIAMGISLTTMMREQDVLALRFDENIDGNFLRKTISKSEAQRGYAKAARLQWDLDRMTSLKALVNRAREESLKNGRCPFLISYMPKRIYKSKLKTHHAQVTKERLSEMFRAARDKTGLWQVTGSVTTPPSFHEVRSLGDVLATNAGYDLKVIQHAMAHSDINMTRMYQAGHELPYDNVEVIFTEEMLAGKL